MLDMDVSARELAKRAGIAAPNFSTALGSDVRFTITRYRWRIERAMGRLFWTSPAEAAELAETGRRLGVDLVTDSVKVICKTALDAGLEGFRAHAGRRRGRAIFRSLIQHFFPKSKSLESDHYL